MRIKKKWHHYLKWEDFQNGMYKQVSSKAERTRLLSNAIEFTGDDELYGNAMLKVVEQWPVACEQNLTGTGINRQAWVGHAACCFATGIPEDVTREAWGYLTQEQQDKANTKADFAIQVWESKYAA